METFNIKSSTLNSQYEYKDANLVVNGSFAKDATNDQLQNISGSCYRIDSEGEQGDYIGNFNGYVRDGSLRYSLSEMTREDSLAVWDAIAEIEQNVLGENNAQE